MYDLSLLKITIYFLFFDQLMWGYLGNIQNLFYLFIVYNLIKIKKRKQFTLCKILN